MRTKIGIICLLTILIPTFLFISSCARPMSTTSVETDPGAGTSADGLTEEEIKAQEAAKKAEAERQRKLSEEQLLSESEARTQAAEAAAVAFTNDDIFFDFDSTEINGDAQQLLMEKADWLMTNPAVTIIIEGHCDNRGTTAYNLALGDRRAETAKAFLLNLGISGSRMTTISYGEERPLDNDESEAAWARNRRAHFIIE
ncbi:MAG: peptidoglycan-associated lipoprotein Pal [Desulfobacteraceae bacterium]|nr:peptidoglycan-associated lipoprotein Pal [Desulfobacteraceae bacterium]